MTKPSVSTFGAGASMVGYLYQIRIALLWAIRRSRTGDFTISIETLDDVSFEVDGEPAAVLQAKHSLNAAATLTDLCPELWKTLRVWMVGLASGEIPVATARFLIATAQAPEGSASALLGTEGDNRNIAEAAKRLQHAAITSSNSDLKSAFDAFLALGDSEREQLLSRIYVVPAQPDAAAILQQLQAELYHVSLHHQDLSVQMLEGWWFKRVLSELVLPDGGIPRAEIDAQISEIQESLKADSLPIDEELDALMVALDQLPAFSTRPFYKQVELVGGSQPRIRNAITSYLQAFRQRSAWTRNDLLFDADLQKYDRRLLAEWELQYAQVCDELGPNATEAAMAQAGRAILKWAEDAHLPIRSGVNVPWVCRGSLHMLAEDRRIGWHPDFAARLKAIFDSPVGGTSV
ncbi:ABC-three component system protein [Ralstonia wenshanensis]|uniref:ABC-three component system protein n=1 Tax=Ralstonia wenshanensis TaxID=2842456 RepID=UPI002AAE94AD|nr:ABC-three component system protein [Ralstonia wenshanensis]MDY7511405.1 ABC-three component system protein [Ralstonia wenshanensis]